MATDSKLTLLALTAMMVAFTGAVAAQDSSIGWDPRSGDAWVDRQLDDINRYGTHYREPFVDEMVRYYGAPRALVNELLGTRRWAPGDVYYACSIAQILGRPCRAVVEHWERDHGKGWGALARELGIQPGSAEFHRLKRGFVPTYDRWARPIDLDRDLRQDFPNRAKAQKGQAGKAPAAKARPAAAGKASPPGASHGKGAGAPGNGDDRKVDKGGKR